MKQITVGNADYIVPDEFADALLEFIHTLERENTELQARVDTLETKLEELDLIDW